MKKTTAVSLICALLALCLLAGCGKPAAEPDMELVRSAVSTAVALDNLAEQSSDLIEGMMKMTADDYAQCVVLRSSMGTAIDEYGIFRGKDAAQAAEIKAALEAYLQLRLDSWMPEYLPEELPKLQGAQVWAQGSYVMYAILGGDTLTAAKSAFEQSFK